VVIAIIGLLSAVVLTSLNTARLKGYESTRFSDLRQMQTVVDSYYADHGAYPMAVSGHWYTACTGIPPFTVVAANNVIPSVVSAGYISAIPVGPVTNGLTVDCYAYQSNGTDYKFLDYNPPNTNFSKINPSVKSLIDPEGSGWAVYSPGGSTW
jgi:type II secretory pathway pseudopilin PulG